MNGLSFALPPSLSLKTCSIDVGPTMTIKILTPVGEVVHSSTYKLLMPEELAESDEQDCMKSFLQMAENWWGTCLARGQLDQVSLIDMPDPQPYLDNNQTEKTIPALEEKVTPEAEALKTLPRGSTLPRAKLSAASAC